MAILTLLFFSTCFALLSLNACHAISHAFIPSLKLLETSSSSSSTKLLYHRGPLLSAPLPINVYILWYGNFSDGQKAIVADFFSSFSGPLSPPSVASWWKTTAHYKNRAHVAVSSAVVLKTQATDGYSLGKTLLKAQIQTLVQNAVGKGSFPADPRGVYFVLSSDDVYVDDFCMNTCGFHDRSHRTKGKPSFVYAWIGNSGKQCAGQCAWPFAPPQYGPPTVLSAPNRDVGMDGMIINIATILAGAATNPSNSGYYQGDPRVPLEAVSACTGKFGSGAYPGFPGNLLVDKTRGGSYNANGANNRLFLLPAMWDPTTQSCTTLS